MHKKHLIENITPFTLFFFRDCIYNSVFSIIDYYGKDILSILLNTRIRYRYKEGSPLNLEIIYEDIVSLPYLMNKLGLEREEYSDINSLESTIKQLIDAEVPVIVNVDSFYEPMRKDTYQKEHLDHCFVVYGYEGNEFWIFEHSNKNTLNYRPTCISKESLIEACEGYLNNFVGLNNKSFAYCAIKPKECREDIEGIKKKLVEAYAKNRIDKDLYNQNEFSLFPEIFSGMKKALENEKDMEKNIAAILEVLGEIINTKYVVKYVATYFNHELNDMAEEVCNTWNYLRVMFFKLMDNGFEVVTVRAETIHVINKLIEIEETYQELLISEMNKFLKQSVKEKGNGRKYINNWP